MVISPGQWKRWPRVVKPAEIPSTSHPIRSSPRIATMPESGRTQRRLSLLVLSRPQRMDRSEEHTSELQSLMRNSYAVFCLKKKKNTNINIIIYRAHIVTIDDRLT